MSVWFADLCFSDHVSEKARVRFPLANALPEFMVLGRNAGDLDDEDSSSMPIPSPVTVEPTIDTLREEMTASINDFDYLVEKINDNGDNKIKKRFRITKFSSTAGSNDNDFTMRFENNDGESFDNLFSKMKIYQMKNAK